MKPNHSGTSICPNRARFFLLFAAFVPFCCRPAGAATNGVVFQIPAAEYSALVELYNLTDGDSWLDNSGWLDPDAPAWSGVETAGVSYDTNGNVTATGHVTHVRLLDNNLRGPVPSGLANLSQLEHLWLLGNQLTGAIPSNLGNLSKLRYLSLDGNQLTGTIPSTLGNLSQLTSLSLSDNQLTGEIPQSFGNLSRLNALLLYNNQLSGVIPEILGTLPLLGTLDLGANHLSGTIPENLGNLSILSSLDLYANQLTGPIPDSLGNLSRLKGLLLMGNQLSGPIPESLGNLSELGSLWLDDNQLTGPIPSSLGNLSQLGTLLLLNNQLSGTIPESLGNLSQLRQLLLHNNQLTGPIPSTLGNLTNLDVLILSDNQLSGQIPSTLGNLSALRQLYLHYNELTGGIPESLGNLPLLQALSLDNNQLTGSIPASLGSLTELTSLDLRRNQLTGEVPLLTGQVSLDADLRNNCLDITPGTLSRSNIDLMISSGRTILYYPQSGSCQPLGLHQILFFDNFEQFPNGTDLSDTNYVPISGPSSASVITSVQAGSPTITATNVSSGVWAYFNNSAPTNKNQYKAVLSSPQTNRSLQVTWNMWIAQTNSGPGMFLFSVPTSDPVAAFNPPIAFMDSGAIVALTNGTNAQTLIGNWSSLAGSGMANKLILDYPNRTFSYWLNGEKLATLPLGPYWTNVVGAIYFSGFERIAGSLGNHFAIDDVMVAVPVEPPLILTGDSSFGVKSNYFGFTISGTAGRSLVVEACTNLAEAFWQPLQTNTFMTNTLFFNDPAWGNHGQRFYRAYYQ